jgi:methyl-accepting chemotaxis protein
VGVVRVNQISDKLTTINGVNSVKQQYAFRFSNSVQNRSVALRDVVLAKDSTEAEPIVSQIEGLDTAYAVTARKMDEIFESGHATTQELSALQRIKNVEREALPLISQVVSLRRAGQPERAYSLLQVQTRPKFVEWLTAINNFIDLEQRLNEQESASARSIAGGFLATMLLMGGFAVAVAIGVAWLITRGITRRLAKAVTVLSAVEGGDLTARLTVRSGDELGRLGTSLNAALTSISSVMTGFASSVSGLNSASERLGALSERIATGAEESSAEANRVAVAAGDVSANVQAVAVSAEQMGYSIQEIAHNAQEATRVSARAKAVVEDTTTTIAELGETSRTIGDVVKVISQIARQTNLLALNATIEAARAGEAGRGFAVVANEVKELSQETARATEDISQRVDAIQAGTSGAVDAIAEVANVIGRINSSQQMIALAVGEQTATTSDMNRGVTDGATGSERIARSIDEVAAVARATTEAAAESRQAVDELQDIAGELRTLVGQFRF